MQYRTTGQRIVSAVATRLSRKIPVDEVIGLLRGEDSPVLIEGFVVSVHNRRMKNFAANGLRCVGCGLQGNVFIIEEQVSGRPYLNLYADTKGGLVMLTRDHIIALADGGSNALSNSQTMCSPCNNKKASEVHFAQIKNKKTRMRPTPEMEKRLVDELRQQAERRMARALKTKG